MQGIFGKSIDLFKHRAALENLQMLLEQCAGNT